MRGPDTEWVFDGGRPCLDLVNTLRSRHLGGVELLTGQDALAEWLELAGFTVGATSVTSGHLIAARALREAVDKLLLAVAEGEAPRPADVQLINEAAAAAPPLPPRLRVEDGGVRREVPPPPDPVASAFAVLAVDAIELAAGEAAVRICAADDCGLRFCDASPRRTRQWCSMARCGNRAKARAHYARTKNR
ncbi:CGNR zinc finger domain-containing protein [Amycolatopsis sp. NPDC059027]|uniref:CGNR zinc finger domain-containing protein n=1 Tax=unclassified Amycolatopsis TaxID=2618356 RepID=UPI0036709924